MNSQTIEGHWARELALPYQPIIYRWWFDELPSVLQTWIDKRAENLPKKIETKEINGKLYYELYVGQAKNGKTRLNQHLPYQNGAAFKRSTLRRTLRALLCNQESADADAIVVDEFMLKHSYVEWKIVTIEDLDTEEKNCINSSWHPFNIQENDLQPKDWADILERLRNNKKKSAEI